jgi:hypothetical protein
VSNLGNAVRALLGVSTYEKPPLAGGLELSEAQIIAIRNAIGGGQLAQMPTTQARWYREDLEIAQGKADRGDLSMAARLCAAMKGDGTIAGLLETLTAGLVRLPRRFYGDDALCQELESENNSISVFDAMFPPADLALLVADGRQLGVGVGELVPVEGRDYPVFVRLEPEFLYYVWNENRWYYKSIGGLLPITPGDGRWILHTPGGRVNPWRGGLWKPLGKAYISKTHADLHRANFSMKLANPARAATAPIGATEEQRQGFLSRVIAWGVNTVFELPVGWDVKLIESNGRGFEVFQAEIDQADKDAQIALAGQVVTTTGGTGFVNGDLFRLIRSDIIDTVGQSIAHTLNTQGLPQFNVLRRGQANPTATTIKYITAAPKDLEAAGRTMVQVGAGIKAVREAIAPDGLKPDVPELMTRYAVPTLPAPVPEPAKIESNGSETEQDREIP